MVRLIIIILISHGGTNRQAVWKSAAAIRQGANALQSVLSRRKMDRQSAKCSPEHSRNDIAEAELCTKAEGELLAPATTRPQTPHLLHGLSQDPRSSFIANGLPVSADSHPHPFPPSSLRLRPSPRLVRLLQRS